MQQAQYLVVKLTAPTYGRDIASGWQLNQFGASNAWWSNTNHGTGATDTFFLLRNTSDPKQGANNAYGTYLYTYYEEGDEDKEFPQYLLVIDLAKALYKAGQFKVTNNRAGMKLFLSMNDNATDGNDILGKFGMTNVYLVGRVD
jgi:hypothetical protein